MKTAGGSIRAGRRIEVCAYVCMRLSALFDFGCLVKFNLLVLVYAGPAGKFQTSKLVLN